MSTRPLPLTAAALTVLLFLAGGCASTSAVRFPATTRLTSVDLERMTGAMAESLLASDVPLQDTVIVVDRVVNRTNHIIEPGEKELYLARLRRILFEAQPLEGGGARFVESRLPELGRELRGDSAGAGPTHALTSTFYVLTRQTRSARSDAYACQFALVDLRSGVVVWENSWPVEYVVERGQFQ